MSMCLSLAAVSDVTIARLLDDPPLVWHVVAPDDPQLYQLARAQEAKAGLLRRMFGSKSAASVARATLVLQDGEGLLADLDKAWHGLHYLLTSTAWEGNPPLNFLVAGGRPVGAEDVGYGPARVFTVAETRDVAAALAEVSDAELTDRFDPRDMLQKQIYPEIWLRNPAEDDPLGYLMEYLATLRGALASAVSSGHGLLVSIS